MTEVGWRRLHPLTPLLRGGRVIGLVLAVVSRQLAEDVGVVAVAVVLAVSIPLAFVYGYASWRATRWGIVDGDLRLETGVLLRRSRRVPLSRLQTVDVVRGLVARALGLAELRLEVVGQGKTEAPFAYLSEDDARALRIRLLALSAGAATDDPETAAEPAEHVLVTVPTGALVGSLLLGTPTVVTAGLLALTVVLAVLAPPAAATATALTMLPALLAAGGAVGRRLLGEYGFTVAESTDGLRLRHGLLETRSQTIPAGRIQAVRLVRPLLWRRQDWVRVEVDVAGYGGGGEERHGTSALLPVAPRSVAEVLIERVLPGSHLIDREFAPVPRRARWRAPVQWRQLGVALDEQFLVARSGWWTRTIDIVPLAKMQSLRLTQGPVQRRLHLATVHADTAGKDVQTAARHRDVDDARQLLDAAVTASRRARARG